MTIVYHVTAKDLMAEYRIHNPPFIPPMYIKIFFAVMLPVLALILICEGADAILPVLFTAVFLPVLAYYKFTKEPYIFAHRTIKKIAAAGPNVYRLTIADEGLIEETHYARKLIHWHGVNEVVQEKERYFILCEDDHGMVINRKQVSEGDVDSFIDLLRRKLASR
ncbi:MAG TPA: YcxB family protein [bacterium]|nr:YcxB family protein [bacterium]